MKLTVAKLGKKFSAFNENQWFITTFIRTRHWSYPEPDESIPQRHTLSLEDQL
jgi:hypothetical protein